MGKQEKQNFEVYAMPNPRAYVLKEDSEQNKYAKLDVVECDTPEKLNIIKNLPNIKWERKEVEKLKYNPSVWEDKDKQIEICDNCKKQNNCNHRDLIHKDNCRVNDCDYYSEVVPQNKQIEEMAEILRDKCFYYLRDTSVEASEKIAEELLKYYQPKLPEDGVVLSKEETELLKNDLDKGNYGEFESGFSQGYEKGSKEAIDKILKLAEEYNKGYEDDFTMFIEVIKKKFGINQE